MSVSKPTFSCQSQPKPNIGVPKTIDNDLNGYIDDALVDMTALAQTKIIFKKRGSPIVKMRDTHTGKTLKDKPAEEVSVEGTFRSRKCSRYCVGLEGLPMPDAICQHCRAVPRDPAFRMLATRRA